MEGTYLTFSYYLATDCTVNFHPENFLFIPLSQSSSCLRLSHLCVFEVYDATLVPVLLIFQYLFDTGIFPHGNCLYILYIKVVQDVYNN